MKRSSLLLVPVLAFCVTQARAGDIVLEAPADAGASGAFAAQESLQVYGVAMAPSIANSKTYASWKSSVNPSDLVKAAFLARIEQAAANHDEAALRHALLAFVVRFHLSPQQAKALFDRYLGGGTALASVYAGPAAAVAQGPALAALESVAARNDPASPSRLDSVYSGEASRPAAADASDNADSPSSPATEDSSGESAAGASSAGPAPATAAQGGSKIRAALAKAISAFTGSSSVGAPATAAGAPASDAAPVLNAARAAAPNRIEAPAAAQSASKDFEDGALAALATPGASKASGPRQGARLLSEAFDNNGNTGKALPAAAGSSAAGAAAGTRAPLTQMSAGYGDGAGAFNLPSFASLQSSPARDGGPAAAAIPGRTRGGIAPVIPAAPSVVKTPRDGDADAAAGPHMTFMTVPVPLGLPARGASAESYAALSLLALAAGAGFKMFLGRALRPSAAQSPLDFNHLLD